MDRECVPMNDAGRCSVSPPPAGWGRAPMLFFLFLAFASASAQAQDKDDKVIVTLAGTGAHMGQELGRKGFGGVVEIKSHPQFGGGISVGARLSMGMLAAGLGEEEWLAHIPMSGQFKVEAMPWKAPVQPFVGAAIGFRVLATVSDYKSPRGAATAHLDVMPQVGAQWKILRAAVQYHYVNGSPMTVVSATGERWKVSHSLFEAELGVSF